MKSLIPMVVALVALTAGLPAQDLSLGPKDLRIEQSIEGGYYLYIRKKPDIASVLLTESTEDPAHKSASYAWRNPVRHPENAGEQRILDGEFLTGDNRWFLVDSSPVADKTLGQAFKIFIPWVVVFGYPWARYAEIPVQDGTFVSVRTFALPHADYRGPYKDNPFSLRITQKPLEGPPEGNYMKETVDTYTTIAKDTDGTTWYSTGEEDLLTTLTTILKGVTPPELDLVLCLDATKSMENDVPWLKKKLIPLLQEVLAPFTTWRIGITQYRDYLEDFLYLTSPFTSDFAAVQKAIDQVRPNGGRDIPEAVNEALYASLSEYQWTSAARIIILVGDAPPHPIPRGKVTAAMVKDLAKANKVQIEAIILPQ